MSDDLPVPDVYLSRPVLRFAVGVAALLAVGVVGVGLVLGTNDDTAKKPAPGPTTTTPPPRTGPVALVGVDAPAAGSARCAGLMKALPQALPDGEKTLRRLPIAEPAPPAAAAWGGDQGEPVVLRCGLLRPTELTPTAALREIDAVRWLPVAGAGSSTWYVVDRAVYVALTVPAGSGTGPLQEISATVAKSLPARAN
ncbi:MAG TPA: DUF3515 domain-containing protein [Actinophytocola sp.]|nr:DUF3515 domain-containing protein [Actinophytocola sp.]